MFTIISALKAEIEPIIKALPPLTAEPCAKGSLQHYQNFDLLRTGVGKAKALETIRYYLHLAKPEKIILIGFAGALNPQIKPGSIYSINEIKCPDEENTIRLPSIPEFKHLTKASLLTVTKAVKSNAQKQNYWQQFQTDLVDMETFYLAQFCQQLQIELFALKGVTDSANHQTNNEFKQNFRNVSQKLFELLKPLLKLEV